MNRQEYNAARRAAYDAAQRWRAVLNRDNRSSYAAWTRDCDLARRDAVAAESAVPRNAPADLTTIQRINRRRRVLDRVREARWRDEHLPSVGGRYERHQARQALIPIHEQPRNLP